MVTRFQRGCQITFLFAQVTVDHWTILALYVIHCVVTYRVGGTFSDISVVAALSKTMTFKGSFITDHKLRRSMVICGEIQAIWPIWMIGESAEGTLWEHVEEATIVCRNVSGGVRIFWRGVREKGGLAEPPEPPLVTGLEYNHVLTTIIIWLVDSWNMIPCNECQHLTKYYSVKQVNKYTFLYSPVSNPLNHSKHIKPTPSSLSHVHSYINSPFMGSIQPCCKYYTNTSHSHISITVYNQTPIYSANWTGASWRKKNWLSFDITTKGIRTCALDCESDVLQRATTSHHPWSFAAKIATPTNRGPFIWFPHLLLCQFINRNQSTWHGHSLHSRHL